MPGTGLAGGHGTVPLWRDLVASHGADKSAADLSSWRRSHAGVDAAPVGAAMGGGGQWL